MHWLSSHVRGRERNERGAAEIDAGSGICRMSIDAPHLEPDLLQPRHPTLHPSQAACVMSVCAAQHGRVWRRLISHAGEEEEEEEEWSGWLAGWVAD